MLFLLKNCQRWGPVPIPPCLRRRSLQTPNGLWQLGVPPPDSAEPQPHSENLATPLVITNSTHCWSTPYCNDQRLDKGSYIRTSAQNREKLTPLSSCPRNVRNGSTSLSVRTHHKFQKIRRFLLQKVRTSAPEEPPPPGPINVRTGQPPSSPWLRMSFMDGP